MIFIRFELLNIKYFALRATSHIIDGQVDFDVVKFGERDSLAIQVQSGFE